MGIAYVRGVAADEKTPKDTRTPVQKAALLALCRSLIQRYPATYDPTCDSGRPGAIAPSSSAIP